MAGETRAASPGASPRVAALPDRIGVRHERQEAHQQRAAQCGVPAGVAAAQAARRRRKGPEEPVCGTTHCP